MSTEENELNGKQKSGIDLENEDKKASKKPNVAIKIPVRKSKNKELGTQKAVVTTEQAKNDALKAKEAAEKAQNEAEAARQELEKQRKLLEDAQNAAQIKANEDTQKKQQQAVSNIEDSYKQQAINGDALKQIANNSPVTSNTTQQFDDAKKRSSTAEKIEAQNKSPDSYTDKEMEKIREKVEEKGCKVEFDQEGRNGKVTGPNPIAAVINCTVERFKKGPFSLNFKLDLNDSAAVGKMEAKINNLLKDAAEGKVAIQNITINGQSADNIITPTYDGNKNLTGIKINQSTPAPDVDKESLSKLDRP